MYINNRICRKGLAVVTIVLLFGINIIPLVGSISINRYVTITSPLGLDLSCNEPYKNIKKGDTATFIVIIENIGTIEDTYDIIAGSIEDIICKVNGVNADQFNPYEITLNSGNQTSFEVTAEVWKSVPIGEWSIFIEAYSQNDTEISDDLTLTVNVQKKSKIVSYTEEDCNECQSNGKIHLGGILLTKLQKNELFKDIINFKEIFNELGNKINPIEPLPPNFFKCCMLFGKLLIIAYSWVIIRGIYLRLDKMGYKKLSSVVSNIWENLNVSFFQTQDMMYDLNCDFF